MRAGELGPQTGRSVVVTGANSGLGLEAARGLVGLGAHVVLAVRDRARGEAAAAGITGPGSTSVVDLDLSDLEQVGVCARALLDRYDKLSALICNAGVMGGPRLRSAQGFERQMAQPPGSRRAGRGTMAAARRERLARGCRVEHRGARREAVAAHPGASATNLFARQLERGGRGRLAPVSRLVTAVLLQSASAGASSTLRALDPNTPSGAFVGPARFAQLRGRPELLEVYASAADRATAARLWELTHQVLGEALPF